MGVCMCVLAYNIAYPACNAHAPYSILICDFSGRTVFFDIISHAARFLEKSYWTWNMFRFSLQFLSKTYLILGRIQRDIVINVKTSSCKVPVILVRGAEFFHAVGRTEMVKLIVAFRNFANVTNKCFCRSDFWTTFHHKHILYVASVGWMSERDQS
jgi:hypothetical protein